MRNEEPVFDPRSSRDTVVTEKGRAGPTYLKFNPSPFILLLFFFDETTLFYIKL